MEQDFSGILASTLSELLWNASAPIVVDVRSPEEVRAVDRLITGAIQRSPENVHDWWRDLPVGRSVVACDLFGGERAWQVTDTLRKYGTDACFLVDGFVGWYERSLPTRKIVAANSQKWVTREHPKIDRIACPWLVHRFINPVAEFIYVPADQVVAVAEETGATPYDVKGVEFTHEGERCSFDKILRVHDIAMPALDQLATIVRGADTSRRDLAPECDGLLAISRGLSTNFPDDHEMLKHGMVIYDALFSWCQSVREEMCRSPAVARQEARRG